jgi:hypothetical protein
MPHATTHYRDKPLKKCDALLDLAVVLISMRKSTEKRFVFNHLLSAALEKDTALVVIGAPEQLAGLRPKLSR